MLAWSGAAPPDTPSSVPNIPIQSYVLANGLKVALSHDPAAPRTTVCVAYHVGSKNERPGLTGFAHFFEHMMFRGTRNVPDFDMPLQQAGGSPNAFTNEDVTVYFETLPNNYVKQALYMEAERMAFLSSELDQEKFDTEREVVRNERRQRMENAPYGLADEAIASYVFPKGHPYSWSVIGSMKDLNRATLKDLRQFFNEFYHPANATLTLVGGFDVAEARQWIETYFGPIAGPTSCPDRRASHTAGRSTCRPEGSRAVSTRLLDLADGQRIGCGRPGTRSAFHGAFQWRCVAADASVGDQIAGGCRCGCVERNERVRWHVQGRGHAGTGKIGG